jgi:SPP1 gp7 family putative phage head morphogenesis protein
MRSYEAGLRQITGRVLLSTKQTKEQTLQQWLTTIADRSNQPDIQAASDLLAKRMIFSSQKTNWRSWREAASRSSHAGKLYSMLQAEMQGATGARVQSLIRENASLISSLPLHSAQTLVDEITKAQQAGARPGTIAKMYQKRFPELLHSRVQLISRTETAKASTALTKARCENLAIEWYEWLDVGDKRTRKSHKAMHHVIVPWSQPPSPEALLGEKTTLGHYHAGECPNCRCVVAPILTLDDIAFPAKIYWNGSVKQMTKPQFRQIAVSLEERTT